MLNAIVQQRTLVLFWINSFWIYALVSSVLPAWYDAARIPFWFKSLARSSVVLRCVAKISIDVSGLKAWDLKRDKRAVVFSPSLVIESYRLRRDKSLWVTICSGYLTSNISQIYCYAALVAVAVSPITLVSSPSFSLIISWRTRYAGLKLWDHSLAQWISSTHTIDIFRPNLLRSSINNLSGVIKRTLILWSWTALITACFVP